MGVLVATGDSHQRGEGDDQPIGDADSRQPNGRGVLEGAFRLLDAVEQVGEAGLTALAAESDLPKATAHRLLDQLVGLGAVERISGRYRMGGRMIRLGKAWQPPPRLRVAARGPARLLAARTKASVTLVVPSGGQSVLAGIIPGEAYDIAPFQVGMTMPSVTAASIALAAWLPDVPSPPGLTELGWRRRVAEIDRDGVAYDRGDCMPSVSCVAAPVRAPDGEVVASVTAVLRTGRPLEPIAETVRRAALDISRGLNRGR